MKIGFDAKRAFTNFTGLGNYSRYVLRILGEYFPGNSYMLYTPRLSQRKETLDLQSLPSMEVKIPSKIVRALKLKSIWRSVYLSNRAKKDGVSLLHGLSNELPLFVNKKVRTVVTIHDLLFFRYPGLYAPVDIGIYKRKFKRACATADHIIAVSQQTAEDIKAFYGTDPDKITVVYQGCHQSFKQGYTVSDLTEIRDRYKLPLKFILNVGTVEPRKNALSIIKALAAIKNRLMVPLVIVGRPVESYKKALMKEAQKSGLTDQIIFLHNVPFEDLPKIYRLSQLFVYPSVFEGFGIPIIEALHSRVPVISSKGSCFQEAGGTGSLYVDSQDYEAFGEAILKVLGNAALSREMVLQGEKHIEKFKDEKIAIQLMDLYKSVLDY